MPSLHLLGLNLKVMRIQLAALLFLPGLLFSQTKELTLEDAILKQRSELAPKRLTQLQWLPSGSHFGYVKEDRFIIESPENGELKDYILLSSLKEALPEVQLGSFPQIKFIDDNTVIFSSAGDWFEYRINDKRGKLIFDLPDNISAMEFDSDFSHCAYILNDELYVKDRDGVNIQVTSDGGNGIVYGKAVHRYEFGIRKGLFWSDKGNKLAFYRKDERMVDDYPLVDISAEPAKANMIKYPMAGRASHEVKLGIYEVGKSGVQYLNVEGPKDQYLTAVTWGPQAEFIYLAVLNRDQNHLKLNRYAASTGLLQKTLFEEKDKEYVEPEHPLHFLESNPRQFLWFSERNGYQRLYRYDIDGNLIGVLGNGLWETHSILGFDQTDNYLFVEGTGEVMTTGQKPDDTRNGKHRFVYMIDYEITGKTMVDSSIGIQHGMLSPDGKYLLIDHESTKIPHQLKLYSTTGEFIRMVHEAENPLAEYEMGDLEFFQINSGTGETLYGRIIKPSNFDPNKKYPLFWYLYGGPHAQMVTDSWLGGAPLWMYWMAEQGYIVATIDNRGSANRGLEFEQQTFRKLGEVEMIDQLEGIDFMKSKSYIDQNRMAIHGWSFGGFMTINFMETFPDVFKAGVAGGPVCDWSLYEVMYTERYMDTPEANPDGYQKSDLTKRVGQLNGDLLVIHGTVDDVVVWQHSQKLLKSAVDEGVQLDYFVYPGHPHNVRGKDRIHLIQKVLDYVDDKLSE